MNIHFPGYNTSIELPWRGGEADQTFPLGRASFQMDGIAFSHLSSTANLYNHHLNWHFTLSKGYKVMVSIIIS
jgi:hypothetical protein